MLENTATKQVPQKTETDIHQGCEITLMPLWIIGRLKFQPFNCYMRGLLNGMGICETFLKPAHPPWTVQHPSLRIPACLVQN